MDLKFLLWLQSLRQVCGKPLENFCSYFSDSTLYLMVVVVLVFYLHDKKNSLFVLASYNLSCVLNALVKMTACVYRPWVREPKIVVADAARKNAVGYSFPSGHTAIASGICVSAAFRLWKKVLLFALCILYVLLIGFSRMFLGCHTPQDVTVGILEAFVVIFVMTKVQKFLEENPEKDVYAFLVGLLIVLVSMIYVFVKPYPMDTDQAGAILADPQKMREGVMHEFGFAAGFLVGWILERRFVKFSVQDVNAKKAAIRVATFFVGFCIVQFIFKPLLKAFLPRWAEKFMYSFLSFFLMIYLAPLVFTLIEKKIFGKEQTPAA